MRCIIVSRHVIFDEHTFPLASNSPPLQENSLDFLLEIVSTSHLPLVTVSRVTATTSSTSTGSSATTTTPFHVEATMSRPPLILLTPSLPCQLLSLSRELNLLPRQSFPLSCLPFLLLCQLRWQTPRMLLLVLYLVRHLVHTR